MANDYRQAIDQAKADIQQMIDKMNLLEQEIVSSLGNIATNIKKTQGASNPKEVVNNIDKQTEAVNRLNTAIKFQSSYTDSLIALNKQKATAENKAAKEIEKYAIATQKQAEATKKAGLATTKRLGQESLYFKELRKTNKEIEKSAINTTKANKARVQEANAIERNKNALLKQKSATIEMGRAYVKLVTAQRKSKKVLQDLIVSGKASSRQIRTAQKDYDRLTSKVNKANKATSNFSKTGLGGMVSGFRNLLGAFGIMAGAQMIRQLIGNIFSLTKELNSIDFAMKAVIKDSYEFGQTQRWLIDITDRYGTELITTSKRYTKFRAAAMQAGLTAKETQKIFSSVTKAAGVLGLKTDELTGIYLALEQMISKGKITTEELRRQLGERLPGAMDIMAASMNITTAELDKMMKKGLVISKDVLPKFAEQIEKAYGIENLNKVETLVASQTRLSNAWLKFIKDVEEGEGQISNVFINLIDLATDLTIAIGNMFLSQKQLLKNISDTAYTKALETEEKQIKENVKLFHKAELSKAKSAKERIDLSKKLFKEEALISAKTATKGLDLLVNELKSKKEQLKLIKDAGLIQKNLFALRGLTVNSVENEINGLTIQISQRNAILDIYKSTLDVGGKIKKNTDDENAFIKGSIGWLNKQIELNNKLIEATTNQDVRNAMREKNIILKERIDLLTKGVKEEAKVLEIYKTGIIPEIKKEIALLEKKQQLSNNVQEIANIERQKKALSELNKLIKEGDFAAAFQLDVPDDMLEGLLKDMEAANPLFAEYLQYLIQMNNEMAAISPTADAAGKSFKEWIESNSEALIAMGMLAADLASALVDRAIADIEREQGALDAKYNRQKELIELEVGDEASKQERLRQIDKQKEKEDEKIQKKLVKEKRKQAVIDKANAVFQIGINTLIWASATAAETAVGGFVTTPLIIAIGAAQAAAVLAQPLPQYKHGGVTKGGLAVVGDGGKHEAAVLPSGEVWKTPKSDTVVDLPKGTNIYPDFDKFQNDNKKMQEMAWGMAIDYNFASAPKKQDNFSKDLRKDVMKSLSGLTINNHSHEVAEAVKSAIVETQWTNGFL